MIPSLVALGVLGVLVGPVLHHLAGRAAVRAPFRGPAPRCGRCGRARWFERRCPDCGEPVRRREPLVWLLTGVAFAGTGWVVGTSWLLPAHLWLVAVTIILLLTDLDQRLIPNRILYPGTVVAAVLLAGGAALEGRLGDLPRAGAAGAVYFLVLLVVALVARGGFGMGDVKLAVLLGLFAGFWSWRTFALMVFFTGVAGGLPAVVLLATGRAKRGDEVPYGPAMVAGAWAAIAFGDAFARLL